MSMTLREIYEWRGKFAVDAARQGLTVLPPILSAHNLSALGDAVGHGTTAYGLAEDLDELVKKRVILGN